MTVKMSLDFNEIYQPTITGGRLGSQLDADGESIANVSYVTSVEDANFEILSRGPEGTYLKLRTADSNGDPLDRVEIESGVDRARVSVGSTSGAAYVDMQNNNVEGLIEVVGSPDADLHISSVRGIALDGPTGFYGATPTARPVITGSTSTDVVESLIAALVALGLVEDGRS